MDFMAVAGNCEALKKRCEEETASARKHPDSCCNSQHLNERSTVKLIGEMIRAQE
jgi:hypothetical protein